MHRFIAACGCNIGRIRRNNEDNFCFNGIVLQPENDGMKNVLFLSDSLEIPAYFAVFDGMGGEAFGEVASYIAAETLKAKLSVKDHVPERRSIWL